jgi:hypothetical protein
MTDTDTSEEPAAPIFRTEVVKLKAVGSSETLVPIYPTTWYLIPDKCNLNFYVV